MAGSCCLFSSVYNHALLGLTLVVCHGIKSSIANEIIFFSPANKWEKKSLGFNPRIQQVAGLVQERLGLTLLQAYSIFNYGCWCGAGGFGKTVDNFDL